MHFTLGFALAVSAALSGSSLQGAPTVEIMPKAQTVEEYVRGYFADIPIMTEIARCESQFRQFGKNGEILKNPKSSAIGVFQIMSSLHRKNADEKLGLDITTVEGNAAYARYLYKQKGTQPWNASKACWGKSQNLAKESGALVAINKN